MKQTIHISLFIAMFAIGVLFGWNLGRQNLIDEMCKYAVGRFSDVINRSLEKTDKDVIPEQQAASLRGGK
jgi:hypothetical protein